MSLADRVRSRPTVVLILAGGNALGAYQAGVYQALHDHGVEPQWVVGTSIGAINGAIIAGNTAEQRIARLRDLWRPAAGHDRWPTWWDAVPDEWRRTGETMATLLAGRPGLFAPLGSALTDGRGGSALYDTAPARASLAALIDVDRLNGGSVRFTAAAVDVDSGEEVVFDTCTTRVTADHLRASAAMPPAFPAVPIEGRLCADGGLAVNLPLDPPLASPGTAPMLCIAVDLLPAAAPRPRTLGETIARTQDLFFAAQTRRSIARWQADYAGDRAGERSVTLVHLVYGDQEREVAGKAMDFSPASARARWDAGLRDGLALVDRLGAGTVPIGRPGLTVVGGQ